MSTEIYKSREPLAGSVSIRRSLNLRPYISVITSLVIALIAARIGLRLIAVNPGTPFGRLIVDLTDLLLWPLAGLTETLVIEQSGLLELSSLIAVIIYPLAICGLVKVLRLVDPFSSN